ncbi:phosphopantetheine-binding protein [Clostridia bacterium OttesenSCG-928-F22]|nr:phosphopantetheine-binding protein [Clostridia bacterium OttesenSCG-928-F22]
MLELVKKIIWKVTGEKPITYDTDFVKDLQLNSFDIINIITEFEDFFDVAIPTRDVWKLHQVKDVIQYMQSKGINEADFA